MEGRQDGGNISISALPVCSNNILKLTLIFFPNSFIEWKEFEKLFFQKTVKVKVVRLSRYVKRNETLMSERSIFYISAKSLILHCHKCIKRYFSQKLQGQLNSNLVAIFQCGGTFVLF